MNKNGPRTKKTREKIEEKFIQLLQEKSFPKITVQDILDAAGINRTTFYRHYRDKYELAELLCGRFFQKFEKCLRERFGDALPDEAALERFSQSIQLFYRDFYEEGDALLALFSIHEEEIHLYDDMCHCLKNAFFAYYIEQRPGTELETDYYSSLYASFVMTSFEWILKNRPEVDVSIYFKKFYRSLHQMMWQDEPCENVPVYRVVRIDEPDFGCEGRPDGAEPMAKVYLESEDGEKIERMEPDAMLYQKEINEGTRVRILADGRMEKW